MCVCAHARVHVCVCAHCSGYKNREETGCILLKALHGSKSPAMSTFERSFWGALEWFICTMESGPKRLSGKPAGRRKATLGHVCQARPVVQMAVTSDSPCAVTCARMHPLSAFPTGRPLECPLTGLPDPLLPQAGSTVWPERSVRCVSR